MFDSSIASALVRRPLLILISCTLVACGKETPEETPVAETTPTFVGSESCRDCHAAAFDGWQGSHHALAMQIASEATILGDFSGVEYTENGSTARFYRRDGSHFVETDGADGEVREFPISYTFGVEPLQQYLIELPRGMVQTLPFAWDTRSADEGGQRWYHIYPNERIDHTDPLHWTRREQNWNFMCAECHSTGLEKNYSADVDAYATTWHEINVGCEGCHGPASLHVAQAADGVFTSLAGFDMRLDDSGRAVWEMDVTTGIASRSEVRLRPPIQPEACGRCHARRGAITEEYAFGQPLTATHAPSLLDEDLYFADGQILGEVYVYGSFLQSKMYQAGVSCTDCHDPHSATLKTGPNPDDICSTCHLPARFYRLLKYNFHPILFRSFSVDRSQRN